MKGYPRLGPKRREPLRKKGSKCFSCHVCRAQVGPQQTLYTQEVQLTYMRGDDEVVHLCGECGRGPVSLDQLAKRLKAEASQ